ncbi:YoaK family protein [Williamsia sp. R60]
MPTTTTTTLRFALLVTCASGFLDSYTFLVRGGVFANVQTGNVIFFFINLSEQHYADAVARIWPIVAFLLGVTLSTHIKTGRLDSVVTHPIRWTMGVQALSLAAIGFVPETVPHMYVTVPISFMAAMQIELFRSIGDLNYMVVATTGNLMHTVESAYGVLTTGSETSKRALAVYSKVIGSFFLGAAVGAFATEWLGVHAAWLPAGFLAVTLAFFILDERDTSSGPDDDAGHGAATV